MTYTATLFDCKISSKDAAEATERFCDAIEADLGGAANVAPAYAAYMAAFNKHGQIPLPAEATDAERAAVMLWADAENSGECAAFDGWGDLGGAHFEIEI